MKREERRGTLVTILPGGITMKFNVTLDRDEDGVWIAQCPAIPGCVSQGNTEDEALENVKDAFQLCLEVRTESDIPLTIGTRQDSVDARW